MDNFGSPRNPDFGVALAAWCRPLSRARATLAKRGHPPWPVRRLGAFAQRGRAHCASWATCREQFGLLFAQSVRRIVPQRMLDVRRGGCWHHGKRHGRTSSTSTVPLHCQGRLEAIPFIAKRPVSSWFSGCAARRHPNVKRQDRALCAEKTKQLKAHGPVSTVCTASLRKSAEPAYWPRPAPVLGQRRTRAGRRSHSCVPERWYVSHF